MTVAYLDHAAATDSGRRYKRSLLAALDLRPGLTVLDVGCGPGTDLPTMAAAVTHPSRDLDHPSGPTSGPASPSGPAFAFEPVAASPYVPASVPASASPRASASESASATGSVPASASGPGPSSRAALCSAYLYASPGTAGRVIGVDRDPRMVDEARRRCPRSVEILVGDAHALPLEDASVDRARADRVLQHLADPERAVAELHRVVRPGGAVVLADPDWDTLAFADPDTATSRAYTRHVTGHVVRNATIGRELARLLHGAGFEVVDVAAEAILFTDHAEAETILRMSHVARRGWESGALDPHATRAWLSRLATGPFVGGFTFFTVVAHRPPT